MDSIVGVLLDFPLLLIAVFCTPFSLWGFGRGLRLVIGEGAERIYIPPGVLIGWVIYVFIAGITFLGLMFAGTILLAISKSKESLLQEREEWIASIKPHDIINGVEAQMLDEEVSDRVKESWYLSPEESRMEFLERNLAGYKDFLLSTAKISPGAKELVANWSHGLEVIDSGKALFSGQQVLNESGPVEEITNSNEPSVLEVLERLARLKQEGALTADEFAREKARVIQRRGIKD